MCLLRWKCKYCTAGFYNQMLLETHISVFHSHSIQDTSITHSESLTDQVSVDDDGIEPEERERLERKFGHLKVVQKFYSAPGCSNRSFKHYDDNSFCIDTAECSDPYVTGNYQYTEALECSSSTGNMIVEECNDTDEYIRATEYLEQKFEDKDADDMYILVVQDKEMYTVGESELKQSTQNLLNINKDSNKNKEEILGSHLKWANLNEMLIVKKPALVTEGIQQNDGYDTTHKSVSMLEFKCKRCDEVFHTKHERRLHMVSHAKDPRYFCTVCGRGFRKNQGLQLHMNVHSTGSHHQCPHCLNYYRTDRYLKEHVKLHIPEEYKFTCGVCTKAFAHKAAFKQHISSHYNIINFICNICGKGYRQKASLEAHLRVHRGERPYACQACGAAFRMKHTLKDHEKLHTDVRPFACDWPSCDKVYTLKAQLRSHKLRHNGHKLHVCTQPCCFKRFFYESHRVRHEKTSHNVITEEIPNFTPL